MNDATNSSMPSSGPSVTRPAASKTTSAVNGAAKVFREFKWGLLTLFLLMVVVIGLVYDGGKKKAEAPKTPAPATGDTTDLVNHNPLTSDPTVPTFSEEPTVPGAPGGPAGPNGNTNPTYTQTPNGNTNGNVQNPVNYTNVPSVPTIPPAVPDTKEMTQVTPKTSPVPPVKETKTTVVPESASNVYVVQSGDTLSGISNHFFAGKTQAGIKAILAANKDTIPDASRLRPGMKLKIPGLPETAAKAEAVKPGETTVTEKPKTSTAAEGTYVVQSGDTLERIARKVLNNGSRWNEIYEMNRDRLSDPGRLRVGMQLKIKGLKETTATEEAKPAPSKKSQPSSTAETKEAKAEKPATAHVEQPVWMP